MKRPACLHMVAVGGVLLGCAVTPMPASPADLPPIRVDVQASEVDANGFVNAEELRTAVANDLGAWSSRPGTPQATRFRAVVRQKAEIWPTFACLVAYTILGCPTAVIVTEVDLTVEVGSRRFHGVGQAKSVQGLYYGAGGRNGVKSATRMALQKALEGVT